MDEQFSFFYIVAVEKQLDFEGHVIAKEILKEGHILNGGRVMCGESMEVLKNKFPKAYDKQEIKEKIAKLRVEHVKLCPECQHKYRRNNRSAYTAWIEGRPKVPTTRVVKA